MTISMIAAVAQDLAIGKDNDLLWKLPVDMRFFMRKTDGHCILTGRKNYQSIPPKFRPLKNRTNIVVTRQENFGIGQKIQVVENIKRGIELAGSLNEKELFIIGGGQIYEQTMGMAQRLYVTEVQAKFDNADTFFPEYRNGPWKLRSRIIHPKDPKHQYDFHFTIWERG